MNKVLLVEDDSTLAMGIEYSLKNEGYEVDIAETYALGKKLADEKNYNLIILDISLPDGNGYNLCKHIRQKYSTPIIFLTALDEEVNIVMGLDIGGDDYITKPFRIRELLSRINAVMRRSLEQEKSTNMSKGFSSNVSTTSNYIILESKDILVNKVQNRVINNGEDVFLTPSEYKLLILLMENSQKVLTRNIILEKLWDAEGDFVDDNTLSVYIRRLREKIEYDSSNPEYIKTIRGVGYKWDMPVRRN